MSGNTPALPQYLAAVEAYVKETNVNRLDLSDLTGTPFAVEAVLSILKFLPESQVTELILGRIDFLGQMKTFIEDIRATKVKKLIISCCILYCTEWIYLAEALNDTQIVELDAHFEDLPEFSTRYDTVIARQLASYLLQSHLTKLSLYSTDLGKDGILSFAEGLHSSRLTSLSIQGYHPECTNALAFLFAQLPRCQITDLGLDDNYLGDSSIRELSQHLPASKVQKLSLAHNGISDAGLDSLAQGLADSNVTELNLKRNLINGQNNFGQQVRNSKIRVLDLSYNSIQFSQMFASNFLQMSSIEELDISYCRVSDEVGAEVIRSFRSAKLKKLNLQGNNLGRQSITEFAAVLKDTVLEDVDLSYNYSPSQRFDLLSGCVKESKLKCIKLDGPKVTETTSCFRFLEGIKNSPLRSLQMYSSQFYKSDAELFAQAIRSSTFTHFDLSFSNLDNIFPTLVLNLKHTSITHLNLKYCHNRDKGVQLLTEHLNETKLMDLDLTNNDITNLGAISLAECCPQTSLIHLNLGRNKIEKEGIELICKHITNSLVTTLNAELRNINDADAAILLFKKAVLENQVRSHKLVHFFKRILYQNGDGNFCFHQCVNNTNIQEFLDECLEFSKSITELPQPAVISTLLDGLSLPMSREEMATLLFDEFPRQFVEFIGTSIEADAWQHVRFLKRADELGFVKIVERLLLSRPLFMIDEAECILHPDVYGLLVKYKQPICNEDIEPGGIERIKAYFTAHSDLEGADYVVNLLSFNEQKGNTQGPDCK